MIILEKPYNRFSKSMEQRYCYRENPTVKCWNKSTIKSNVLSLTEWLFYSYIYYSLMLLFLNLTTYIHNVLHFLFQRAGLLKRYVVFLLFSILYFTRIFALFIWRTDHSLMYRFMILFLLNYPWRFLLIYFLVCFYWAFNFFFIWRICNHSCSSYIIWLLKLIISKIS